MNDASFHCRIAKLLLYSLPLAASSRVAGVTRSSTAKLFLELAGNVSMLSANDIIDTTDYGGGLTIGGGYGITPSFAGAVDVTFAVLSEWLGYMLTSDVGARYHFSSPSRPLVPYLEIAGSLVIARRDFVTLSDDPTRDRVVLFSGKGFMLGCGVLYFFKRIQPQWAFRADLKGHRCPSTTCV